VRNYGDPPEKKNWPVASRLSRSLTGTDTDQSDIFAFLSVIHSNHGPMSHRFRDKKRYLPVSPTPVYLTPRLRGSPGILEFCNGAGAPKNYNVPISLSKNVTIWHSTGTGKTDSILSLSECIACWRAIITWLAYDVNNCTSVFPGKRSFFGSGSAHVTNFRKVWTDGLYVFINLRFCHQMGHNGVHKRLTFNSADSVEYLGR